MSAAGPKRTSTTDTTEFSEIDALHLAKSMRFDFGTGNVCGRRLGCWSAGGALAIMLRVAVIVLAILVSYDHFKYNGKFTSVATQASTSIMRHFHVL